MKLLVLCSFGWVVFTVIGGPSYYQAWSFTNLLYFCIAVYFALGLTIYRMIKRYEGNKLVRSFWVAYYITIPLMLYDYVYITYFRGEPFELLNRFWVLSIYYIIPWIQAALLYFYIVSKDIKDFLWVLLGSVFLVLSVLLRIQ